MSNLAGLNFYGDSTITRILKRSLVSFSNWGFLEKGAFINIPTGTLTQGGVDASRLYPSYPLGYSSGTVWTSSRNDWIWENSIPLSYTGGSQPLVPSGIYFNGTFVPTGTAVSGINYRLDFSRGRAVFDSPISAGSIIQVPHAIRGVSVYTTDGNEYRSIVSNWREMEASGTTDFRYKAYLPAVFVDVTRFKTIRGSMVGSPAKFVNAEFKFDIFTSNEYELEKLIDIFYDLEVKHIPLINVDAAPQPLNSYGELVDNSGTLYPNLRANYSYGDGRFSQDGMTYKNPSQNVPIYRGYVKIGLQFDSYPL